MIPTDEILTARELSWPACGLRFLFRSRFSYLHQLRPEDKLRADSAVILIRPAGFGVDPWETPAYSRIVGLRVNGAYVFLQEHAPSSANSRSPLPPACAEDQLRAVFLRNAGGLLVTESDTVCAA